MEPRVGPNSHLRWVNDNCQDGRRDGCEEGTVCPAQVKVAPTALFVGPVNRATERSRLWRCRRRKASTNFSPRVGENTREGEAHCECSSPAMLQWGGLLSFPPSRDAPGPRNGIVAIRQEITCVCHCVRLFSRKTHS